VTTQRDFVDFLCSLAPDGETPLVITQRPRRDNPEQYTYPAALPGERLRDGAAVFGNTASFVLDRMEAGRPSASLANAARVLVMVLDDIGQGSRAPDLQPTWIMETSPDNFQWGYAFEAGAQPEPGEFAAAIKAIAEAGYTDPGAINAARNFRLPGSVNLKPGKERFASVLHEFDPERRFTLPEILDALGVTPGEASAPITAVRLSDDGSSDSVLQWLASQGLVLGRANAEGWVSVVCPNHAQHTDGKTEGRYHPVDRGYKCLHGHCQHITTERFLEWVGENGGPQVSLGVRTELLSERLKQSIEKLKPEPNPVVAATAVNERQRIEKADWFSRYAYLESDDAYFDLQNRKMLTRAAFNAVYRHVTCKSIKTDAYCEASIWYDQNRVAMGGKSLVALTYAAGEGSLVSHNGELKGNLWRDARPKLDATATHSQVSVGMWLDLCRTLVPEQAELEHIWNVMAFKVQNAKVKINHAILHMGDEGAGKDTMWAPFLWSVCGPDHQNRAIINGGDLTSQWGYAYESEVLVLNELHEPEAAQRRQLANRLKPLIAAPPDTISINRKMQRPYDAANRLFVLAFSNEAVPISLSSQDRRWFVVRSAAGRLPEAQAKAMWTAYKAGGYEAIGQWLHTRDVSAFNPAAIPMSTEVKQVMISDGLSGAEDYLVGLIERRSGEFARGYVSSRWSALIDRLQGAAPPSIKLYKSALFHALKEAGWISRGRVCSAELPSKVDVWCAPEHKDMPKSDLRRLVEPTQVEGVVTPFRKGLS
jgi:hypothetical protein